MKGKLRIGAAVLLLTLLLAGGAYMVGRLLGLDPVRAASGSGPMIQIATASGQVVRAEWVRAPELPAGEPDVGGAFDGRDDNRFFINETEGGLVISKDENGSLSVTNTTGKVSEVVVTGETIVRVDTTLEHLDEALNDGKCYQQLAPGSADEVGEMSFVRAWGEMRGDRLIASVLLYSRPPVISR